MAQHLLHRSNPFQHDAASRFCLLYIFGEWVILASLGLAFGKSESDPIEKATRNAIEKAVQLIIDQMETIPWEGRVAVAGKDDDGKNEFVVNRGENDGLKVGDVLQISHAGKEIIDPDTGEKLGRSKDKVLGECKIVWTDKRICHVEPIGSVTISKGDIVKITDGK